MDPHRLAELRSLAFHEAIAARLAREPELTDRARERIRRWTEDGQLHPELLEAWAEVLHGPVDALAALLRSDDERARAMRQSTPFAGALEPRERWRLWREVRSGAAGSR